MGSSALTIEGAIMNEHPLSLACAVLTVSNTRTAGDDTSGNYLAESLAHAGHACIRRDIVPENIYQIRRVVSDWIADPEVQVVFTNGGTGFTQLDATPEAVSVLLDKEVIGFGELFRHLSFAEIGASAIQSRALAGYANDTLIVCLPGSTSACRTAWDGILREQMDSANSCNFAAQFKRTALAHKGNS
jgi:molybdenum cofactor biosynthesis protein B